MTDLIVPLTLEQQWFVDRRIADGGARMSLTRAFDVDGPLDVGRFLSAAQTVVSRHQGMRTAVRFDSSGHASQVIKAPTTEMPMVCQAIACRSREQFETYATKAAAADVTTRWDPVAGPLYTIRLLRRSEEDHVILATFDHLAFDDRAIELFFGYLWTEYARPPGESSATDAQPTAGDLAGSVRREHERFATRAATTNANYWIARYAQAPAWTPAGFAASPEPTLRESASLDLDGADSAQVRSSVARAGATTLEAIICVLARTAFEMSPQDRMAVYLPLDNRPRQDVGVIGNFACVRPLVLERRPGAPDVYLQDVRTQLFRAFAHRHLDGPSERRAELSQAEAAGGTLVRRSVAVNYIPGDGGIAAMGLPSAVTVRRAWYTPSLPAWSPSLALVVRDTPDVLRLSLLHSRGLLDGAEAISRLQACAAALRSFGLGSGGPGC